MEINTTIKQEIMRVEKNKETKWNTNFNIIYDIFKKSLTWFKKNKHKIKFLIPIAIVSSILMVYMIIKTTITIYNLNKNQKNCII